MATKVISFDWAIKYLLRDKKNFDILEGLYNKRNIEHRLENLKEGKKLFKRINKYKNEYPSYFEDYINFVQFVNDWLINQIEREMSINGKNKEKNGTKISFNKRIC